MRGAPCGARQAALRAFVGRDEVGRARPVKGGPKGTETPGGDALAKLIADVEHQGRGKGDTGTLADPLACWPDAITPDRSAYTVRQHRPMV